MADKERRNEGHIHTEDWDHQARVRRQEAFQGDSRAGSRRPTNHRPAARGLKESLTGSSRS